MGAGPWPRVISRRSGPRRQESLVTSVVSSSSTIRRRASTSSNEVAGCSSLPDSPPFFLLAMWSLGSMCPARPPTESGRSDAGEVLAVAGVDLQHVTLVDEEGDVHHVAGLQLRRLEGAAHRVAADAGIALHHLQIHRVGQGQPDGLAVVEEHRGLDVLLEEVPRFPEHLLPQEGLLVVAGVHEVVVLALLVEELHLPLLDVGLAHLVPALEGGLQHPAGQETLDAGADEGRPLSRLDVLDLDDLVGLPVHLDLQALAKFGGIDDTGHGGVPLTRAEPHWEGATARRGRAARRCATRSGPCRSSRSRRAPGPGSSPG